MKKETLFNLLFAIGTIAVGVLCVGGLFYIDRQPTVPDAVETILLIILAIDVICLWRVVKIVWKAIWNGVKKLSGKDDSAREKNVKKEKRHSPEYVDLGLPSGTLWATCNVGATEPEEYGQYFAWGETQSKNDYNWNTYKYSKGQDDYGDPRITKYCTHIAYGYQFFKDGKTELDPDDDSVTMNWGSEWQMPSLAQFRELFHVAYTKTEWTVQNGVYGRRVTSNKNGNSIFLPAAGRQYDTSLVDAGSGGYYWSSWLDTYYHYPACYLAFSSDYIGVDNRIGRCYGMAVRPVRKQK